MHRKVFFTSPHPEINTYSYYEYYENESFQCAVWNWNIENHFNVLFKIGILRIISMCCLKLEYWESFQCAVWNWNIENHFNVLFESEILRKFEYWTLRKWIISMCCLKLEYWGLHLLVSSLRPAHPNLPLTRSLEIKTRFDLQWKSACLSRWPSKW